MPELGDAAPLILSAVVSLITAVIASAAANASYFDANKSRFRAERLVRRLLKTNKYSLRSFEKIRRRVGGFSDDELRQILVRSGAVRFYTSRQASGEVEEFWGLYSRNKNLVDGNQLEERIRRSALDEVENSVH